MTYKYFQTYQDEECTAYQLWSKPLSDAASEANAQQMASDAEEEGTESDGYEGEGECGQRAVACD